MGVIRLFIVPGWASECTMIILSWKPFFFFPRVANFFYNLVADKLISKEKEKEIHQILGNDYKLYKEKSKDDGLSL